MSFRPARSMMVLLPDLPLVGVHMGLFIQPRESALKECVMDIDSMTIGDAKKLAAMFGAGEQKAQTRHPHVGRYVIVRSYDAGVFAGVLREMRGPHDDEAIIDDCRRLWSWKGEGVALSGVANTGLKSGSRVDAQTQSHAVRNVIETIPCSPSAESSIRGY